MPMISVRLTRQVVETLLRDGEVKVTTADLERHGASVGGLLEGAILLGEPLLVELRPGHLFIARKEPK